MAAPDITITDSSNVAKGGAITALGKVAPGATSATTTERVWNDFAAAGTDDARNLKLIAQARIQGDTEWLTADVDLLERRGVQVRITQRNNVAVSEAFQNIGTGVDIPLPDLASEEYHEYEVQIAPPAGASEAVTEIKIAFAFIRFFTINDPASAPRGIFRGVGGGRTTAILSRSIAIAVSGTATFEWPDFAWYYLGVPLSVLDHDETIDNLDGSSVALGAGESYIFLAVLDGTTTTIVKGDLAVGPSFPADAPTAPAGNRVLGHGERFADADATPMTFTSLDELPDYFNTLTSGLTATVARAGGPMIVDGSKIDPSSPNTATLIASSTNTVQQLQDGSLAVTDGSLEQVGAEVLVDIVTDGSGETSRVERRRWADRSETIRFDFGPNPTGTITLAWPNPLGRPLYFRSDQLQLMLDAVPGAGNVLAELFIRADDGGQTTLFTSSGSDDRRPRVTNGDPSAISNGLPEELKLDVDEALECTLTVTTATPAWAVVTVIADVG